MIFLVRVFLIFLVRVFLIFLARVFVIILLLVRVFLIFLSELQLKSSSGELQRVHQQQQQQLMMDVFHLSSAPSLPSSSLLTLSSQWVNASNCDQAEQTQDLSGSHRLAECCTPLTWSTTVSICCSCFFLLSILLLVHLILILSLALPLLFKLRTKCG